MVNKPHAPRNGAAKSAKKSVAATANGEDTSFIVFGNDDKPAKKSKAPPTTASTDTPSSSKSKTVAKDGVAATDAEKEKKPDVKTLIAGASWTGKLPVTLFNEHCQKQRWEKPEYTTKRMGSGFSGAVIIRQWNAKTREMTELSPIITPKDYMKERGIQNSAVEARHFAAAYALYRVSNMKNVHMMLPPQYRDLWRGDFADLKSEAVAQGNGYLYEADPFLAKRQHEEMLVKRDKQRADAVKQKEEDSKQTVVSLDGAVQGKHVLRGWQRVPKVEMGTRIRRDVERLIRNEGIWNPLEITLSTADREAIVADLSRLGFRGSHVEEAAGVCKDRDECLEWLLIHVPEDDLPKWALPENYLAGVSLASSDMKREATIKRLVATGYTAEVCGDALTASEGDEAKAAQRLQNRLLGRADLQHKQEASKSETWEEEQATLEAIYGDRYTYKDDVCSVLLEVPNVQVTLRARSPGADYPARVPVLGIEADLPAYIRLSVLKQCLTSAEASFLGEQMLFNIIDWLEREMPGIVHNPGKLVDIARATTSSLPSTDQPPVRSTRRMRPPPQPIRWKPDTPQSQRILSEWTSKQSTPEQQRMMQARQGLPAWKLREAIVAAVSQHQVTIISGETGSGKSTQSVQFILDDLIHRGFGEQASIVCTQPRRISALGLADRVADERCGAVGQEVGYIIRGESKQRAGTTKIAFVTTGVLLRRLQTSGGSTEDVVKSLADVSHVVIDEVHERSLDTDFLLVLLRDVLRQRADLKVVLMSATLDAAVFEQYFSSPTCSVGKVEIEGRTHPVTDIYLDDIVRMTGFGSRELDAPDNASVVDSVMDEDPRSTALSGNAPASIGSALRAVGMGINYDMIARTVQHIDHELGSTAGGILIFLPGLAEIDHTLRALRNIPGLHALPLHASLQSSEQRRVFQSPPHGLRKVVAATNVAETSITIEDIVAVIDTGRVKETSFDPADNMVKLTEVWASRAACKQRRGRAGRVRAGKCYKLYTRAAEMKMAERPDPEIRRVPLEQLCLSVKAMGIHDVPKFLSSALTPPEHLAVSGALRLLGRMGALDSDELTALGRHLSMIPADLRCGKLIVYGTAFGCLDACLIIAAALTVKSPFVNPQAKRDESKAAKMAFAPGHGDSLCDLRAFQEWSGRRSSGEPTSSLRRWCDDNFLNHQTLTDIASTRTQYIASLQETGFLPAGSANAIAESTTYNRNNHDDALIRALVAGAFQPQLARIEFPDKKYISSVSGTVAIDPEARTIKYFNEENGRVFVHPSSTLFNAQSFPGNSVFVSYFSKMATSKVFVRDLTPCNVFGLLMFSGPVTIDPQGRGLLVDGWLRLRGWARIGVLVSRLRAMLDDLLARKVDDPALDMESSSIAGIVKRLIDLDGLDR